MPEAKDHFLGRHYDAVRTHGPVKPLNPTKRYHAVDNKPGGEPRRYPAKIAHVWRSRDNRKGRHVLVIDSEYHHDDRHKTPKPSNSWEPALRGMWKMLIRYPVWDVSYDVAVVFTIGSVIWVINGFFSWLPVEDPSTKFSGETSWAAGLTAFIGATVFEFGSVLLMLEAVNENRSDCFGWAVEESLDGFLNVHPAHDCRHSHAQRRSLLKGHAPANEGKHNSANASRSWSWWPTRHEFRTHYFRDIGFLACFSQLIGATVFWVSGITALPPILNHLSTAAGNGIYWLPQVVGGTGFIVSSALFMLEVQPRWYVPAPGVLGWHIGLWNFVGAIGFTLCGALGFGISKSSVEYAATLSTFIGSWAFLVGFQGYAPGCIPLMIYQVGSVIQWYESLDKYPLRVEDNVDSLVTT